MPSDSDLLARLVARVHPNLDPLCPQPLERQCGQQLDRFLHVPLSLRAGPQPVADLEVAQLRVDATQAGATQQSFRVKATDGDGQLMARMPLNLSISNKRTAVVTGLVAVYPEKLASRFLARLVDRLKELFSLAVRERSKKHALAAQRVGKPQLLCCLGQASPSSGHSLADDVAPGRLSLRRSYVPLS
jgi:hypothetical protein